MKKYNFPFTAILGQENMILGLILNVIDPKIGGVLLTGQQGTGKSTAVRSLVDILPAIEVNEGCQFNCNLEDKENLCEFCQTGIHNRVKKPISLVNLPLGATEEMVIGSLNIEKIIQEGKRAIQPGLFARANRGILYVDEINLLQDHLVDILLDVSASGVNLVEREGISQTHFSSFILVGSMNPEEGELRPQISDRLGLEVEIKAPNDPIIRAEISKRVIEFTDNPEHFCLKYQKQQEELSEKIERAKKILKDVTLGADLYALASQIVIKLGLYSQRADITFLRCARAQAAMRGSKNVEKDDLERAALLVFEHRLKRIKEDVNSQFLGNTFEEIFGKIKEATENPQMFDPAKDEKGTILKHSPEVKEKYKENPLNKENQDIPEVEEGHNPSKDRYTSLFDDEDYTGGYKVGDDNKIRRRKLIDGNFMYYHIEKPLSIDTSPILGFIKQRKRVSNYTGKGSRLRVLSKSNGRYIFAQRPKLTPHSIAFDASIKNHFLQPRFEPTQEIPTLKNHPQLPYKFKLNFEDIQEKIFELKAPLSLYFIVDASASMKRTLDRVIKIIQSVHAEGYKRKDKVSILSFQGREARILQRPSVFLSLGMQKLKELETTSYTPLASALKKTLTMIQQEKIKGTSLPVIIIMSDLGANISEKYPDLNAQTQEDFRVIENEIDEMAHKIGKQGIKLVVLMPKKGFATKYLGINPTSVKSIQNGLLMHASAKILEADLYDAQSSIILLKSVLE